MQKLVTIYLDNNAYRKKFGGKQHEWHGLVEEHLQEYLDDGWFINSVAGFGSSGEGTYARGWIVVVLARQ
jgi:hypothetical protein